MNRRKKDYWLALDDDAHLERIGRMRLTRMRMLLMVLLFLGASLLLGSALIILTPLKNLLPGYLQESQRTAGVETLLRLDSLRAAYDRNEAYLNNINTLLNTGRAPRADSLEAALPAGKLTSDSLLAASRLESDFVKQMRERERYNVSILAPLAAEGMIFYPVSDEAVFSEESKESEEARIMMPSGSTVGSVADGSVISVTAKGLRLRVIVQHPKGFISRYSGLREVYVKEGDVIYGGQAVGASGPTSATPKGAVTVELWHNGSRLRPYEYISGGPVKKI